MCLAASVSGVSRTIWLLNESSFLNFNCRAGSGSHGRGGVAFGAGQSPLQLILKKLYGPSNLFAATSSLSGTFLTCSNEVQIHWGRLAVLCTAWKPISPRVSGRHGRFTFGSPGGIKTSAFTIWKFFALISLGPRIFQETLSIKAPSVPSAFWPGGKSTAR